MGNTHKRSNSGSRPLAIEDASKQIVPFGGGRSSEQIGDLSMALAFALENGGKLRRMDSSGSSSVLGFLQQIGRRSLDFGKMETKSGLDRHRSSTSRFPTLSHLHVKEISKGAQKLNQILRACSNGLNFDRYSIEIGKELLKGAMDLEESLRMLVNLQEASEYMVSPQRKNRIKLLEGDEDDDDNTVEIAEQKQLARPRFSFDKSSRNSYSIQEVARTGLKQRLMALTYPTEAPNFSHEQRAGITSNSVSHKRSASTGTNSKTAAVISEHKNHSGSSQSKPEKKGIPNVIAKLMGLEELPEQVNSKNTTLKESSSKKNIEGTALKKTAQGSTKNDEPKVKVTENLAPQIVKQKVTQANKISATQDTAFVLKADKNLLTRNSSFEMGGPDRKSPWKDSENAEGINPATGSKNATIKINKQQSNITQSNHVIGNRKDTQEKERRQDYAKHREQKGIENGETKELVIKDELQRMAPQTHKTPETANMLQDKTGGKESTLQTERRSINRLLFGSQQKTPNDVGFQQQHMFRRSEPQEEKRLAEEREQQNAKQTLQFRKQRGSEAVSKSSSKPMHDAMNLQKKNPHMNQATLGKKFATEAIEVMPSKGLPTIRRHEDLTDGSSTSLKVNMKDSMNRNSDQHTSLRDLETDSGKAKVSIPPIMAEKPVQVLPSQKKVHTTKLYRSETPRKIDEVVTRKNGTPHNFARPLKHQISILQEMKQRRHDKISGSKVAAAQVTAGRSKEAEIRIIRSKKSEASIQPSNKAQQLQKEAEQASTLYSPRGGECESLKEPHTLAPNDTYPNITSEVSNEQQGQALILSKDQELKSHKTVASALHGTHRGRMDMSYPSQLEHQKNSKLETQEPLTEIENHLKQILMKSQLFLNTAEALFKLNIPFGILHASSNNCQDEDSMLILDCGYEIMRRRGRRQELTVHPCMNISISSMKVRSLDDLVKQLHRDFGKLKYLR
ncbi:hypothetical protein L1049_026340 [Liquidambar formosana]|uniref:DUF3741 domain-containing protein n=1 Tax=Liquidambar formosana TaxID=63359 RepID=A0AAP0NEP3_LIQFO